MRLLDAAQFVQNSMYATETGIKLPVNLEKLISDWAMLIDFAKNEKVPPNPDDCPF